MRKIFLLTAFLWIGHLCHSAELDRLKQNYENASNDSLKATSCISLGDYFETKNIETSIEWTDRAIFHARKFKNNDLLLIALSHSNYYYSRSGNYPKAVERCLEGLKIAEQNKLYIWQARFSGKIGASYQNMEDSDQAIKWLRRSIELYKKHYPSQLSKPLGNLGGHYINIEQYDSALVYLNQALDLKRKSGDRESLALTMGNIASCYIQLKQYAKAEKMLREAYAIRKEFNDQYGTTKMLMDFSWLYGEQKDYHKSIVYADSARQIAIALNFSEFHNQASAQMAVMYAKLGNYKKAYEYHMETFDTWKDIYEQMATENLNDLRTAYETDKFEADNLLLVKNGKIKDLRLEKNAAKINSQRVIIVTGAGSLFVLFLLIYFLVKWNKQKKAQNVEMQIQKRIVEQKNEEILASIQYAKRIQTAILPHEKVVKTYLPESFILYKPKDIVAGDFYWVETYAEDTVSDGETILFAAADCTGHGVPGAMVSVVCNNGLNRSVREDGLIDPGEILNRTREIVVHEFEKSEDDVNDGMDIALCSLNGMQLKYAGANNPLWIIRNGELIETKADKQPIGKFEDPQPYTTHSFEMQEGDLIYIFSDGFVDQFGGPSTSSGTAGKKFMRSNFRDLLLSISDQPMEEQKRIIDDTFEQWKGTCDQVDDVCVIGVKVTARFKTSRVKT